jgi:hypothetical protein
LLAGVVTVGAESVFQVASQVVAPFVGGVLVGFDDPADGADRAHDLGPVAAVAGRDGDRYSVRGAVDRGLEVRQRQEIGVSDPAGGDRLPVVGVLDEEHVVLAVVGDVDELDQPSDQRAELAEPGEDLRLGGRPSVGGCQVGHALHVQLEQFGHLFGVEPELGHLAGDLLGVYAVLRGGGLDAGAVATLAGHRSPP